MSFERTPASLVGQLERAELRLYELIWRRALASQMASAVHENLAITLHPATTDREGLVHRHPIPSWLVLPSQHFTEPPPRFSEGSLVRHLEELGIGRPSTYTSIMRALQERGYCSMLSKAFVPQQRGQLVTALLTCDRLEQYVQTSFTAQLGYIYRYRYIIRGTVRMVSLQVYLSETEEEDVLIYALLSRTTQAKACTIIRGHVRHPTPWIRKSGRWTSPHRLGLASATQTDAYGDARCATEELVSTVTAYGDVRDIPNNIC